MDKDQEAEFDRKLFEGIEKYGWFVINVGIAKGETGVNWSYSLGFQKTLGQPEIIVTGLRNQVAHHMIGEVYGSLKAGHVLQDGDEWTEPLEGYTCVSRKVHPTNLVRDWFGYGLWYWQQHLKRTEPYEVYQLFWPGVQDKLLPWQDGVHQDVIDAQPRLDLAAGE